MVKNMDARKFVFSLTRSSQRPFPRVSSDLTYVSELSNNGREGGKDGGEEEPSSPSSQNGGGDLVGQDRLDIPRISHPGGRKRKFDRWNHLFWPDCFLLFFSTYNFVCYYKCNRSKSDLLLK